MIMTVKSIFFSTSTSNIFSKASEYWIMKGKEVGGGGGEGDLKEVEGAL